MELVCEGKASAARAEFGVQFQVTPYPQRAIATRLHCEKPHGHVARQWFADGEKILRQGLSGSGLYIILDGSAAIRIDGVDRATLRAGDYFGEISCLLGEAPTADIVAIGPLRCLVLAVTQVESFLKANPTVMYRLLQGEARKVRTTTKWLS